MNITTSVKDNILLLRLDGDLIGESSGTEIIGIVSDNIEKELTSCAIDLSGIRYMNSSGLGVLITILTKFKNRGGKVTLINPSSQIEKLLAITRLNDIFNYVANEEEALERLK